MKTPAVNRNQTTAGKTTAQPVFTRICKHPACKLTALLLVFSMLCGFSFWQKPALSTRTLVATESIAFDTTYIDLPSYYRGYQEITSPGVPGERRVEAQVLYEGDRPIRVISIKSTETAKPVSQVMRRGTKVLRTATADGTPWKASFIRPLKTGWLSADFYDYPHHNGIDLAAPYGTAVYAAAGGTVSLAGWYGEYGRCVIIDHADGSQTLYAHNSSLTVSRGQTVKQGQQIAKVGSTGNSTGNHLHFEIRSKDGAFLDPLVYMGK